MSAAVSYGCKILLPLEPRVFKSYPERKRRTIRRKLSTCVRRGTHSGGFQGIIGVQNHLPKINYNVRGCQLWLQNLAPPRTQGVQEPARAEAEIDPQEAEHVRARVPEEIYCKWVIFLCQKPLSEKSPH